MQSSQIGSDDGDTDDHESSGFTSRPCLRRRYEVDLTTDLRKSQDHNADCECDGRTDRLALDFGVQVQERLLMFWTHESIKDKVNCEPCKSGNDKIRVRF